MKEEHTRLFLFLILVLAVIGVADSLHLLEIKYSGENFYHCDLSETFNCSSVNHSPWSALGEFPTAGIGLVGYLLLGLMSFTLMSERMLVKKDYVKKVFNNLVTPLTLLMVAVAGLLIQIYYTYIEFFVLNQFCVFCLFSQALILGIAVFAYMHYRKSKS